MDDIEQVARLGLIKAVRRWQPDTGGVLAYLVPTVEGEIKRYFRDASTAVRIPRALYEAQPRVKTAERALQQQLRRQPTASEISAWCGLPVTTVRQTSIAPTLCKPLSSDDESLRLTDLSVATSDRELASASLRALLRPAIESLSARERRIIALRFIWGKSQAEIAQSLHVSQMHISRLLRASLTKLRAYLEQSGGARDMVGATSMPLPTDAPGGRYDH